MDMNEMCAMEMMIEDMIIDQELVINVKQQVKDTFPSISNFEIQRTVADMIEFYRTRIWCERTGHQFVVESHGGPESGGESGCCKRCGYFFSHTFY